MQLSIYMYLVLIILILLVFNINGQKDIECPQICKCDMFEKHRRATCKNQKLVVIEADVPPQVQLLDMSYNIIRELSDHIFIVSNSIFCCEPMLTIFIKRNFIHKYNKSIRTKRK